MAPSTGWDITHLDTPPLSQPVRSNDAAGTPSARGGTGSFSAGRGSRRRGVQMGSGAGSQLAQIEHDMGGRYGLDLRSTGAFDQSATE